MNSSSPRGSPPAFAGHYDVVIVAATPGGIACALRVAREGRRALLVEPSAHVGGMWSSGVQVFDTRYAGHRCPVLAEFVARLEEHYRRAFGDGSPEHAMARFGDATRHGERPRFEPHVAEKTCREMLADCPGVRLVSGFRPESVGKEGNTIREVVFQPAGGAGDRWRVTAEIFVDASYEADLAALAGAAFRVGREGRDEFGEPHAGTHFTTIEPIGDIGHALARRLNLHFFNRTSRRVFPGSTGRGDGAVQAYTVRLVLTDRPANRSVVPRPAAYLRQRYLGLLDRSPEAHTRGYPLSSHLLHGPLEDFRLAANIPNGKMDWLGANLVGGNHDYPGASLARRRELYRDHAAHALGLLYFLQHDPAVPAPVRDHARAWGLARDEYPDNGHIPPAMYVREARRLAGRHVFSERDASRHPRHGRTPIHPDAVAFAEWPMDSHDCRPVRQPGSGNDGEFILAEATLPSQVPYRAMVTDAVDNLLVPVCLSATHVGWGTLRLEPVFVHTGEAAGVAAAVCLRDGVLPGTLSGGRLQSELLRRHIAVTYFADVDLGRDEAWTRDAQFLGARGFFSGYEADPNRPVSPALGAAWQGILSRALAGDDDPNEAARRVAAALDPARACPPEDPVRHDDPGAVLLRRRGWHDRLPATTREACHLLGDALREAEAAGISA
ncbi:MAG: FAD-dependent oxidoreductase [Opitutaceae bacterium]|nr:FAD-dependent oxidoreductase [Opitutaceae bacterium]